MRAILARSGGKTVVIAWSTSAALPTRCTLPRMLLSIQNSPMRYSWGATGAISQVMGAGAGLIEPETDNPKQAELWFGAHHGSPSRIAADGGDTSSTAESAPTLRDFIAENPQRALGSLAAGLRPGDEPRLPFLMKVLAASEPLSLQAHPRLDDAIAGFAAENERGVPLDAPNRNYRDASHKPELLIALTETMDALAGFRVHAEVLELVRCIAEFAAENLAFQEFARRVAQATTDRDTLDLVAWLLSDDDTVHDAVTALDRWLATAAAPGAERYQRERRNLQRIRQAFPEDSGCLTALLMNHVSVQRGEAIYIQAGILHAYLQGVGIEVMAASDNVLRGGLTPKHIDVPELLRILRVTPTPPPFLAPLQLAEGVQLFKPNEPDFQVQRVAGETLEAQVRFVGPAILLAFEGELTVTGATGARAVLGQGDALYVTPDEGPLEIAGAGDCVVASVGVDAETTLPLS